MNSQKYSTKKGRARLSRNNWNIQKLLLPLSSSFPDRLLPLDSPFGPLVLDKSSSNKNSLYISSEFKEQFSAHQILKTYYGDLNKFQINDSLLNLESRLDVLVYRTGVPRSIYEARNLIRHKKVFVNDTLITDIWAHLSVGSSIKFQSSKLSSPTPPATHLLVKHLPNNVTFAIFKKPLNLSTIRYPKGFDIDKLLLAHSS